MDKKSMESIPFEFYNPLANIIGYAYGKVKHAQPVDNDFKDRNLFPKMRSKIYRDHVPLEMCEVTMMLNTMFESLKNSSLTNL